MVRFIGIVLLSLLLTSCAQYSTNNTVDDSKKLRYNHISDEYEYAEDDEQLRYNHIEEEYSYE